MFLVVTNMSMIKMKPVVEEWLRSGDDYLYTVYNNGDDNDPHILKVTWWRRENVIYVLNVDVTTQKKIDTFKELCESILQSHSNVKKIVLKEHTY